MLTFYGEKRFASLMEAGKRGRADTAKGGPWLRTVHMTAAEWEAYSTGLHRQACPGSANRRQRRHAHELFMSVERHANEGRA